jgi:hypothetical protein
MRGILLFVVAAAIALGSCGGGDDKKSSSKPAKQPKPSSGAQATATTPAGKKVAVPEDAIATRKGAIGDNAVKLEVLELKRSDQTSTLTLRLTPEGSSNFQIGEAFDDGVDQKVKGAPTSAGPVNSTSMDGIALIDTKNRKRYLVGHDTKGVCVCDSNLGAQFVGSGTTTVLSATYAAPPADVGEMDVVVPRFGTFKNVPVS